MTLFLDTGEFADLYGQTLSAAQEAQASLLLGVVDGRIRDLKGDDPIDEDDAKQVCFEVVRDAITYGGLEKLSSFDNESAHRKEAGVLDAAMKVVDDYLSDRHKRLLGISVVAAPSYSFTPDDFGPPYPSVGGCGRRRWC